MPKVAVICLCYNHEKYVIEAIESVMFQTFKDWELIIVDDASTDNSVEKIETFLTSNASSRIQFLKNEKNLGNCKSFNKALALTDADYCIDLAADDLLFENRLAVGVSSLEEHPKAAVNFTNATYIWEDGRLIKRHYPLTKEGKLLRNVPQGDVFKEVVRRYFICTPTMMFRTSALKELGGYDPALAYEDFDIKVRLSRLYPFTFSEPLCVAKRVLKSSMSANQYKKGSKQLNSTLIICQKVLELIKDKEEKKALLFRIAFEGKEAFRHGHFSITVSFLILAIKSFFKPVT
jgi:glycosyltransferase involved in cell wall biosynthesis